MRKHFFTPAAIGLGIFMLAAGCAGAGKISKPDEVREVRPGILEGYLEIQVIPNSLFLLPPPPVEGSTAEELDREISQQYLENRDSSRWDQAIRDVELVFPEALQAFSGILDVPITPEETPQLYLMLQRVVSDASLSTYMAKRHYMRARPFMVNGKETCIPGGEQYLREDGSYPSGHTAIGWTWALILSEIFPEQSNFILARGREFGESRIVCNVHWYSDVVAGRLMGAATVARLHADPTFMADLKRAKKEVARLRK